MAAECCAWLAVLSHSEWDERGRFALWFYQMTRLPDYGHHMVRLKERPGLPEGIAKMVAAAFEPRGPTKEPAKEG